MQIRIRILNEVSVVVLDLLPEHVDYFYEKYAVHAPNYFFNPRYKLGQWDGKIRFFHKTGKTYLYLLEDLLPRIAQLGYKVVLEDLRTSAIITPVEITADIFKNILHPDDNQPTELREHQVNAVNSLIKEGYGLVVSSTGSGKTLMSAALCHQYGQHGIKTLTIVPNRDLIHQTRKTYLHYGLDTGEYSGERKTLDHQHVVSTWQALKNAPNVITMFDMVVVDECHGLKGHVLSTILTDHAAKVPYRFGFTGTLPKEKSDVWAVHVAVGPVRYKVPAAELIEKGLLAKININLIQLLEDLTDEFNAFVDDCPTEPPTYAEFKEGYFPDFSSEKSFLQHKADRITWLAQYIEAKRDAKKGNVLCLVDNIAFGRKLVAEIQGAIFVNGQDIKSVKDRKTVYDMFSNNDDLVVIATVHIAGTGIDIHRIFNLMLVDIGKSFIRVIQAIGRGLRLAKDKDSVLISDISSDLKYSRKHMRERIKYYKEAQYPHKLHKMNYVKLVLED